MKRYKTTIEKDKKGYYVVVPKEIATKFNLKAGQKIKADFDLKNNRIYLLI